MRYSEEQISFRIRTERKPGLISLRYDGRWMEPTSELLVHDQNGLYAQASDAHFVFGQA